MNHDPSTPVIVGVGAIQQRHDDPVLGLDALGLIAHAVEAAGDDAGSSRLLDHADVLMVPQGTWSCPDPAALVMPSRPDVRSIVADIGVLQQTLLSRACTMIVAGEADVVVVAGGEAKFRALRAQIAGVTLPDPAAPRGVAERIVPAQEIITRVEIERGLPVPARQYAIIDTALRHQQGLTPGEHQRLLDELWSRSSAIAVQNPHAWNRTAVTPADIRGATPLAWPYTKLHCSQWNVDQAAAIIVCSAAAADRFGTRPDGRIFAQLAIESNLMVPMTTRASIHRSPAVAVAGDTIRAHLGREPGSIEHLELYSCFPAAVRVQTAELGIDPSRPLTVTGGMTFGGGPLNNATLQGLVRLVEVLRGEPAASGLITNISGMLTKFGASVWSASPTTAPFASVDITAAVAARTDVVAVDPEFAGRAQVVGYTVACDRGEPVLGIVVGDACGDRGDAVRRCVATTNDPKTMEDMCATDWCDRAITVDAAAIVGS